MDDYQILSMFGQGTFGRLYKAILRPKANIAELPGWVTVEASKRDERKRAEEENEREGEAAVEAAAAAASSAKQSEAAASSSAAPSISTASGSSLSLSSSLMSLLHETLVIKEVPFNGLPPQEQQDILNEVRVMSAVNHPAIIAYYDSFLDNGCLYIVMELAQRGDLSQLLTAHKPHHLSEPDIWRYMLQLLEGLSYLHAQRILHRDIKPANIFLDESGSIKIGDLGLGRILGSKSVVARTGVGTPLYFSPELCQDQPYDEKADVWALGALLYEMATFQPPFTASNQIALAHKIVHDEPAKLPALYSGELRFLILKMLEKDASKRPSIDQMLSYSPVKLRRSEMSLEKLVHSLSVKNRSQARLIAQHQAKMNEAVDAAESRRVQEANKADSVRAQLTKQYTQVCEILRASEAAQVQLQERLRQAESAAASQALSSQSAAAVAASARDSDQLLHQYAQELARERAEKDALKRQLQQQSQAMQQLKAQGQQQPHATASQADAQRNFASPAPLLSTQPTQLLAPVPVPSAAPVLVSGSVSPRPQCRSPVSLPASAVAAAAAAASSSKLSSPHTSPSLSRYQSKVTRTPYLGPAIRVPVNGTSPTKTHTAAAATAPNTLTPKKQQAHRPAVAHMHAALSHSSVPSAAPAINRQLDWSDAAAFPSSSLPSDDDVPYPSLLTLTPHTQSPQLRGSPALQMQMRSAPAAHRGQLQSPEWQLSPLDESASSADVTRDLSSLDLSADDRSSHSLHGHSFLVHPAEHSPHISLMPGSAQHDAPLSAEEWCARIESDLAAAQHGAELLTGKPKAWPLNSHQLDLLLSEAQAYDQHA